LCYDPDAPIRDAVTPTLSLFRAHPDRTGNSYFDYLEKG